MSATQNRDGSMAYPQGADGGCFGERWHRAVPGTFMSSGDIQGTEPAEHVTGVID